MNANFTLRQLVYAKTDGHCWYCGKELTLVDQTALHYLCIDHCLPSTRGGSDDFSNLAPSCRSCNCSKRDRTVEEYRAMLRRAAVDVDTFSVRQIAWLTAHNIDIEAMIAAEMPEIIFFNEREAQHA